MIIFRALSILVLAFAVAGCSPAGSSETVPFDSGAPTSTAAPSTTVPASTTTTTTTLPTHAVGYPEVPVSMRKLDEDEISYSLWTRSEQEQDKDVPEFVYGNDFTPSNMDLDPPRPVQFTNSTEDDIVILFGTGDAPDLAVVAGATETLDFSSLPEEIYRFHVFRGNAKISGFVDMRSQETSIVAEPDDTPVRQAPFSGRFSVVVPAVSEWDFNPQYDAIVAVPKGDDWEQGDFQWSLATGARLRSSGMRLRIAQLDDPSAVLVDPTIPENCEPATTGAVEYSGLPGMESAFECGSKELLLGYLEAGDLQFIYALSDAPADPAGVLLRALDTIELHPAGDAVPRLDRDLVNHSYEYGFAIGHLLPSDAAYPLDIEGGALSSGVAATNPVTSATMVDLRNFDEVSHEVSANGADLVDLHPGYAVEFDLLAFEADVLHTTVAAGHFVGYGVMIDLTVRSPGPPIEMHVDTARVISEVVEMGVPPPATRAGITGVILTVPAGWTDDSNTTLGMYEFSRGVTEADPAAVLFKPATAIRTELVLRRISNETRVLPREAGLLSINGLEWKLYHWAPDGHPSVTLAVVEIGDDTASMAKLTSAPEDHAHLYDFVLIPMISEVEYLTDG